MSQKMSQELAAELASTGMKTNPYRRSPVLGAGFIINQTNDQIRAWVNKSSEFEITGKSKKHRQATLTVTEGPRTISRTQHIMFEADRRDYADANDSRIMKMVKDAASRQNSLVIPGGRRSTDILSTPEYIRNEMARAKHSNPHSIWMTLNPKVKFSAKVTREQTFNLLCGIDEVAHFICALPEKATSIKHAHEMLRPENVKPGTKRQGEFFFVPVDAAMEKKINEEVRLRGRRRWDTRPTKAMYLERSSSHFATCAILMGRGRMKNRKMYVTGPIMDTREGRHEPLVLKGWHSVVRNNEIVMPASATQSQTQYWD